jgi:hypothetical protein
MAGEQACGHGIHDLGWGIRDHGGSITIEAAWGCMTIYGRGAEDFRHRMREASRLGEEAGRRIGAAIQQKVRNL